MVRQSLQEFVTWSENDCTYRTKSLLWLGIGSSLTGVGTIGPRLPSVRVDVLGVNMTDLSIRIQWTGWGDVVGISHTVQDVYRAPLSTDW